jgi:hypothetical protein
MANTLFQLKSLLGGLFASKSRGKVAANRQPRAVLSLEPLEERALLSATNPLAPDGGGSLGLPSGSFLPSGLSSVLAGLQQQLAAHLPQLNTLEQQLPQQLLPVLTSVETRLGGLFEQVEGKLQSLSPTPITDQDPDTGSSANALAELQMENATLLASRLQSSDANLTLLAAMSGFHPKHDS